MSVEPEQPDQPDPGQQSDLRDRALSARREGIRDDVREMLSDLKEGQAEAAMERNRIREEMPEPNQESNWTFVETFQSVLLSGIGVGSLGVILSLLAGSPSFVLFFLVGLIFLIYTYWSEAYLKL